MVTFPKFSEKDSQWLRLGLVPASGEYTERKGVLIFSFMCPFVRL